VNLPSVSVITPSIGSDDLKTCAESVAAQSHLNLKHYIVIDGIEFLDRVMGVLGDLSSIVSVVTLPENTGAYGFRGHRIYAALPYLLNTDYVSYLDEDNWFDKDHITYLIDVVLKFDLDWAYSLRKICSKSGQFVCKDDCDSLGIWGQWYGNQNHIDSNCYLLKRALACEASHIWYRKGYSDDILDPDKALCRWLLNQKIKGFTSGAYTVNYRLGSTEETVGKNYFIEGNQLMAKLYKYFPWNSSNLDHINEKILLRRILSQTELLTSPLKWARSRATTRGGGALETPTKD
jgi:hypothetical protein